MSSRLVVTATTLALAAPLVAVADAPPGRHLLTQRFAARPVDQVEVGDFHFLPGQLAPLHTHVAPVFGYVSKGTIFYQVAGQPPQLLHAGDAFYEPVGPDIVHFDNASATEEAIFTDFNFERAGEPFIVFPKPLTEKIDRRAFPSERLAGVTADTMTVVEQIVRPAARVALPRDGETVYVYVAEGSASVTVRGEAPIVYLAGQAFYAPSKDDGSAIANGSTTAPARLIAFHLTHAPR
jgi:quercetin dioxygenase-like cupin family protein